MGDVEPQATSWLNKDDLMKHAMRNGVIAIVLVAFILMVIRPFLKWALIADVSNETPAAFPRTVAEIEADRGKAGLAALSTGGAPTEEAEPVEKKEEAELVKKIQEKLLSAPKKGVRVVQDWLEDDGKILPAGELEKVG